MKKMLASLAGLWGLSVILASTSMAFAGGFASARFGGEHGHPVTDNPTAIYYNPAGLALKTGTRVFGEGLLVYRRGEYKRPAGAISTLSDTEGGTPTDAVSANAGTAKVRNVLVSPFLGVASDLGVENLGVGLAVFAPFGGQASWDQNSEYKDSLVYPGAVDGVQRWATMEGSIKAIYISGAAAYRLPDVGLSFGASVSLVSESLQTLRARNALGNDDLVSVDGSIVEGRSFVDVKGKTVAAGLGVIWDASEALRLGLSYQSRPGFGETTQKGTLDSKFGNGDATVANVKFTHALPDIVRFGLSLRPSSQLELRLSGDYTRWSLMRNQCLMDASDSNANCTLSPSGGTVDATKSVLVNVVRNWNDTFGVRAGGSYWLNENTELAGSLAYDSNAVPDKNADPTFIDANKVIGVVGGRLKISSSMLLNLSYTHVYYITRDVPLRQRDSMGNPVGFDAPSKTPDHGGTYSQTIGLLNVGMEYLF